MVPPADSCGTERGGRIRARPAEVTLLQLLPVVASLLVLGAHFLRGGNVVLVVLVLAALGLLGVRRPWAARTVQAVLLLGAVEWVRSLVELASWRAQTGQPATRLVVILGSVAIFTGLSALVFRTTRLRLRFAPSQRADDSGLEGASGGSGTDLRDE